MSQSNDSPDDGLDDPVERIAQTEQSGQPIIVGNLVGTVVFAITAVIAAVQFGDTARWSAGLVAFGLFAVGIAAFLMSFYWAVQRSRTEQLGVFELYFLAGPAIPTRVRRMMNTLVAAQVVVGIATALARPNSPDGRPGSSLALGVLVPMFGLGLNGTWAARHGTFGPRVDDRIRSHDADLDDESTSDPPIGQNDEHG